MSRRMVFESSAFADFNEWAKSDKKIYRKIFELIKDIDRSPFEGLGKPEPLKYELNSTFQVFRQDVFTNVKYAIN
jgi:toxin YoeB